MENFEINKNNLKIRNASQYIIWNYVGLFLSIFQFLPYLGIR